MKNVRFRFRVIRIDKAEEIVEIAEKFIVLKSEYNPEGEHHPESWELWVLEEID